MKHWSTAIALAMLTSALPAFAEDAKPAAKPHFYTDAFKKRFGDEWSAKLVKSFEALTAARDAFSAARDALKAEKDKAKQGELRTTYKAKLSALWQAEIDWLKLQIEFKAVESEKAVAQWKERITKLEALIAKGNGSAAPAPAPAPAPANK
jgi:hypothetical protein